MISNINNIEPSSFQPELSPRPLPTTYTPAPLNSFDDEDTAIISSQAKLLNELDKFNAGSGNPVDLAVASVMAKTTVSAEVDVIKVKKDMIDDILDIGK